MNATVQTLSVDDHRKAMIEVSFLLNIFAKAMHDLMGGATAPVGRIAGRKSAAKMPLYLPEPTIDTVLAEVGSRLSRGFDVSFRTSGKVAELDIGRCPIRKACVGQGEQPGGAVCVLFHHYLDGVVNELLHRPTKSVIATAGERCTVRMDTR